MIFSLDVRRAHKGDCLLLHFGSRQKPGLVLIDGGPKDVYQPSLKPRLLEIKQARGLDAQTPLPVDLLMVSHVDDDHIQGILELTRELTAAGQTKPPLVRLLAMWHNSFDDVIANDARELSGSVAKGFGPASVAGGLSADAEIDLGAKASDARKEIAKSTLLVLASIEQGYRLRGDARQLNCPLNPPGGALIQAAKDALPIGEGLSFTVAGPTPVELAALQKKHAEWLKTRKKKKTPVAELAAYVDKSVPNLSSIVVLAECGGKKMLLTGDARGDNILKGLEAAGALKKGGKIKLDLLKVPHHGSSNNLDDDFFERIVAEHYVFSGDGEHGNPEREAMEMLWRARGNDPFTLHLTYPVAEIDAGRVADWKKAKKKAKWSPAKQGLVAFFKSVKVGTTPNAKGQKISVVEAGKPHVIDLLEKLGY